MALTFRATDATVTRTPIRPPGGGVVLIAAYGLRPGCLAQVELSFTECGDYTDIDFAPIIALGIPGGWNGIVRLYWEPTGFDPETDAVDPANYITQYALIVYPAPCVT